MHFNNFASDFEIQKIHVAESKLKDHYTEWN